MLETKATTVCLHHMTLLANYMLKQIHQLEKIIHTDCSTENLYPNLSQNAPYHYILPGSARYDYIYNSLNVLRYRYHVQPSD